MLRKKGVTYIDWIISMGLFIIVVVAVFAFFKPGTTPAFKSESLIASVENNFIEEASWTETRVPITIELLEANAPTAILIGNDPSIIIEHSSTSDWEFSDNPTYYDNLGKLTITKTPNKIEIKCTVTPCSTTSTDPEAGIYIISNQKSFPAKDFELSTICNPDNPDYCEFTAGSREDFTALSISRINTLITKNYNDIKTDWSYPAQTEFKVTIYREDGTTDEITSPASPPHQQANIFVKEISTFILHSDGRREPVKVNIMVW